MSAANPSFVCASCARTLRSAIKSHHVFQTTTRSVSSGLRRRQLNDQSSSDSTSIPEHSPRWKQTPATLRMPLRLRPLPKQPLWEVNKVDEKLDQVYDNFCGRVGGNRRGRELLSEEVKWTAITHKTHAHGTQGFNDRLAYLGKRIVDLQCSIALLSAPFSSLPLNLPRDEVFQHPALEGIENVTKFTKLQILNSQRLSNLAKQYELEKVVRWKPRRSDDLKASGQDTVLAHTMYSLVGALAMQCGGEIAARAARERILRPLGLK